MTLDILAGERPQPTTIVDTDRGQGELHERISGVEPGGAVRVSHEVNQELLFQSMPTPRLNPEFEAYMEGFHPFTTEVMRAQLHEKWKWPKVDPYDGTSDPDAHVKAYMTQANLFSGDLRVHCRLFPTTLKGIALEWYYYLPQNSINSFRTLCSKFIARFIDSKPMTTVSTSLHHVSQGRNETLRQFMSRFTKACLNIPNLHPTVAMHAITVGLKPGLFLNTLYAEPPSNMDELRARATKYIAIEENAEASKKLRHQAPQRGVKRKRMDRYDVYTSLNASRDAIIQEAYNFELVRLPQPV